MYSHSSKSVPLISQPKEISSLNGRVNLDFPVKALFEATRLLAERSGVKWIMTVAYEKIIGQRQRSSSSAVVSSR